MIEWVAKNVGGKVITAVLVVTSAMILLWYYNLPPAEKQVIWDSIRHACVWVGVAAALPWGLFFVPPLVVKAESNLVAGLVMGGYLAADVLLALWLGGLEHGTLTWGVLLLGFLCAGVYNFVVSDFLAERADDAL